MTTLDPEIFRAIYGRDLPPSGVTVSPLPALQRVPPEAAAEGLREQRRTGVDALLAAQNLQQLRAEREQIDWDALVAKSPRTAQLLADRPAVAAAARDDMPAMNTLADAVGRATGWMMGAAPDGGLPGVVGRFGRAVAGGASFGLSSAAAGALAAPFGLADQALQVLDDAAAGITGTPRRRILGAAGPEVFLRDLGQQAGRSANALMPDLHNAGNIERGFYSGAQSLGQNLALLPFALLPGGAPVALGAMAASAGGQSYLKAREKGVEPAGAAAYGASDAVVELGTERFALGPLLDGVKAGAPFLRTLLATAAREVPGEQLATVLQDLNEWAALNPDRTFGDYLQARPDAAAQTLVATLVGTGGQVAVVQGVQRVLDRAAGIDRQAGFAARQQQVLAELATLAEATKLRQRDPESFAEFAQSLTDEQVPTLYADARTLMQSGITSAELEAAVGAEVAAQLGEAAAAGADLVIPTGEFLARAPGSVALPTLLEHLRTAPEAMSAAEGKAWMAERGDALQAEIGRVLEEQQGNQAFEASRAQLQADFEAQFKGSGRFDAKVGGSYSTLLASFFAVQAAKLGKLPGELAQQYQLRISAAAGPGRSSLVLNQGQNDQTDQTDEATGLPLNSDGTVTVYHHTSAANAEQIRRSGRLQSAGEPDLYFTTTSETNTGYGDTAIAVRVKPERLVLDGQFPDGRQDFRVGSPQRARRLRFRPDGQGVLQQSAPSARPAATFAEARAAAAAFQGKPLTNAATGIVAAVSRNNLDKMLSSKAVSKSESPQTHSLAVANLDSLFERAVLGWSKPDGQGDPNIVAIHRFFAVLNTDGGPRAVKLTVKETAQADKPNPLYTVEAVELNEKSPAAQWVGEIASADGVDPRTIRSAGDVLSLAEQVQAANSGGATFNKDGATGPRGQIAFAQDITAAPSVITLFNGADLSTFIHEAGHFFLQMQADMAARIQAQIDAGASVTDAERGLVDDMSRLLAWFGVQGSPEQSALTEWLTMTPEQQRQHHETFARGFELYAFEGKSPSLELQGLFQSFRAWLVNVYRAVTNSAAAQTLQVQLTNEVRSVMDRMLATDQAIAEAHAARSMGPLFETAAQAGMTPEQWASYQALGEASTASALEALQARSLRDLKWLTGARSRVLKDLQRTAEALRRDVRTEVRGEVMRQPLYRAWQFLTGKGEAVDTAAPTGRQRASKAVDPTRDSLLTAIAKEGGLARESAQRDLDVHPDYHTSESGVFGMPLFRKEGGQSAEHMLQHLTELGYLHDLDEFGRSELRELRNKIADELGGAPQYSHWHDYARDLDEQPVQPLPETALFGKLDTEELRWRYGTQPDALWRKLSARRMTSEARGVDPDVVAETFGFSSGDELVRALADAVPPDEVIEALTTQRMLERYADLATPQALQQAADAAVHNEARARVIAAELDALQAAMPRERTGRRSVDVLARAAGDYARGLIARQRVRDLQPARYAAAAARAARQAMQAQRKGDTAAAAEAKRMELIQQTAAREAIRAQAEVDRARAYLRRMAQGPKRIPADYLDQVSTLLERHELKQRSDRQADRRASFSAWVQAQLKQGLVPELAESLLSAQERARFDADLQLRGEDGELVYEDEALIAVRLAEGIERSAAVPWREMTVEQVRGLVDAVRQVEHLGRLKGRLLANRQRATFEAARDEIVAGVREHGGQPKPLTRRRTRNDDLGRAWQAVVGFAASHIKVSTWARMLDGGRDNGAVWRHIVRPANERASWESTQRALATERLQAILAPALRGVSMRDMSGKGRFFPSIGDSLNWQERFSLALNTGNEGNLQRLLDGAGWTRAQIEPVLQSLSAAEWRVVQSVWDFFEGYRPQIAELERRTMGKEPQWVQPMPLRVRTADGQDIDMRGGYFPIRYDPRGSASAEANIGAEEAKALMRAANLAAGTRRGFVKPRAAQVRGRPLLLNLQGLYGGVTDVIHDLAWREWLIDTGRLLRSDAVQQAVREHYGPSVMKEFRRWTEDIAAGSRRLDHGVERAAGLLRQHISLAALSYNLMSAAMQPLGLANSMARVGKREVLRAAAAYAGSPVRMTREAMAASEFLRNRTRTRFRELNELRNTVEGQTTAREVMGRYGYWLMMRTQLMVDVPTWWAAHDRAQADGRDDATAVALADQAVKDAQGGGEEVDQAGIERGGPLVKLFTAFYGYMGSTLNTVVLAGTSPQSHARRAANIALVLVVPAMLGALLKAALIPGGDDEDDVEAIARKLVAEQLSFLFGLVIFGREFAFLGKQIAGEHAYGYSGPGGLRTIADVQKLGTQAAQGEFDQAFAKSFVSVLGDLTGIPSVQINRTITGAGAVADGEVDGAADSFRALAFGYERSR